MGQLALGLRSLLVKAAIFFVLCALLVSVLGGQLFPKTEVVDTQPVMFQGQQWFWRLSVGGKQPGEMHWALMIQDVGAPQPADDRRWSAVTDIVVTDDGLFYAGRPESVLREENAEWQLCQHTDSGRPDSWAMPDRLAVEQQLERVRHGLPLQDVEAIRAQRPAVLDPQPGSADETTASDM